MNRPPFPRIQLARLLLCLPFFVMLGLMVIEAVLGAATTYLVIQVGRDVANDQFLITDLLWILVAQSAAYVIGAVSWIYAERAGFLAFGRYMLRFARDNRHQTQSLIDKEARERSSRSSPVSRSMSISISSTRSRAICGCCSA
jgi:hypothetical protein